MKEATAKKIVLMSFQEQGMIGLFANFQLWQSSPSWWTQKGPKWSKITQVDRFGPFWTTLDKPAIFGP